MQTYDQQYPYSIQDPEGFWMEQAREIPWFEMPEKGLSVDEKGFYRWYRGGKINLSYVALDYHVENGRGDQAALIYDSPVTGKIESYTFREMRDEVAKFAGVLAGLGVQKGDTVVIYMPMIPQAAVAMFACARLGAIHSVVFGGFAPHELAIRIDDAQPKVLVTANGGIEISRHVHYKPIVDQALKEAQHKVGTVVLYQREEVEPATMIEGRDHDWATLMETAEPHGYVEVDGADPLYILYTSGTTGKPKGIIRENGGYAVALKYSMNYVYHTKPGEVYWAASDIGWVVGHSYIIYGPLINGCTSIMFEGKPIKTPDPGTFWRVINQHNVKTLFTAPTAFRAIKKEDPNGTFKEKYPTPSLEYLFLAGERCDVATYNWSKDLLEVPVIDNWWQTESGWPMISQMPGYGMRPVKPGSASKAVCGYDIRILGPNQEELGPNEEGAVCIKLPLPPSCLPTLWNNDDRFRSGYLDPYPGFYFSGDGGYKDEDGYIFITGRIDDIINVAGHRLSTAEMEEAVASHPDVAECCVIGIEDELKGQIPVGFFVKKEGVSAEEPELERQLIKLVREQVGPVAAFKRALLVKRLPKTRSGKILRKTMRMIADGKDYKMPSTIEDPQVLDEITTDMQQKHVGQAFA
ncbi:MAG: propionyl-CoA synthetase [Bacteroidota bacterium]